MALNAIGSQSARCCIMRMIVRLVLLDHLIRSTVFVFLSRQEKAVSAKADLLSDQHPPSKFRVIGTLSQFAPFAETFQCPKGSKMNPESKCHLW